MGYRDIPVTLEDLESHIDAILSNLKIYRLPLFMALQYSLTVFEARFDFMFQMLEHPSSRMAGMLHVKHALQVLVPELFKHCSQIPSTKIGIKPSLSELRVAVDAIKFCERYGIVSNCFTQFHQGWYTGAIKDRVAIFSYPEGTDVGHPNLNLALHQYHEDRTISRSLEGTTFLPSIPVEKTRAEMQRLIDHTKGDILSHPLPYEVYRPLREIIEPALPEPTLDRRTRCTNYTVDDYYHFWIEFSTLMLVHCFACHLQHSKSGHDSVAWARVMILRLPDIAAILARQGNVDYQLATNVLSDLTLDYEASRSDILVQPLIPIPKSDMVIIAPSLIYTCNWEVCLLRNWIMRYRDKYGHVVAQKKERLADELARIFSPNEFRTSVRKKIRDNQGKTIGDVDVAVYDKREGLLAIFELKWLIEPDSIREAVKADQEISRGIEQVSVMQSEYERDSSSFLEQIFPDGSVKPDEVRELKSYVVGHGDIGGKKSADSHIPVLDYFLICDIVSKADVLPLSELLTRVINQQQVLLQEIVKKHLTMQVKLGGFLFRLPGYGDRPATSIFGDARKLKIGRNDRCLCGSGIKYKICCQELEGYIEDAF
jgi:hypothetical protein